MANILDDQLGNVTQAFKDKGLWENTLMILTSDNGGFVKEVGPCTEDLDQGQGTACF